MSSQMTELVLHNARVVLPDRIVRGGVVVRSGLIASVFDEDEKPSGIESIDLGQLFLAPGLIDIHIHGSAGVDVQNADQPSLDLLSEFLLAEGVTSYFATFVPTDDDRYRRATDSVARFMTDEEKREPRARIAGIHFEGPFVSLKRCGALQTRHFRIYDGDPRSLGLFTLADRFPTLMTLAPEVEGGLDLVRELTSRGVRVFIGHTQADLETLDKVFEAGAHHITHFPNALDPLHHRNPGAVGWGLLREGVTMDCIADFHHVHPMMLKLMHKSKGGCALSLISDAIQPAGLGDGEYLVWGDRISIVNGRTALVEGPAQGAIAGSVITMREALKNFALLGVPLNEAVSMATLAPARAAGIGDECGSIERGKRADLIAFDEDFSIRLSVVGGKVTRY